MTKGNQGEVSGGPPESGARTGVSRGDADEQHSCRRGLCGSHGGSAHSLRLCRHGEADAAAGPMAGAPLALQLLPVLRDNNFLYLT